jgi:cytochrome bd-type quinol oxidase subunit 2
MKRYSPYISAGLVIAMFYVLYQIKQVSTMPKFAEALHNTTLFLLFTISGLIALGLSLSGFKSKNFDNGLKYVSYFGFFGSIIIVLGVWLFPFFV